MLFLMVVASITGCRTPAEHRRLADKTAYTIVEATRSDVLNAQQVPFCIEKPSVTLRRRLIAMQNLPAYSSATLSMQELKKPQHWPKAILSDAKQNTTTVSWTKDNTIELSLLDSLQIAARNSSSYQAAKERIFSAALSLDLERNNFRSTFAGAMDSEVSSNTRGEKKVQGTQTGLKTSATKTLQTGAALSGQIAIDLAKLLTGDRDSAWGLSADATISIPLMRGSGKHIVRESLTQSERDVIYAIYSFEEFKRNFSVNISKTFLGVMQADDQAYNSQRNYETLVVSANRAKSMAEAGRLPEFQVDQAQQDKLRSYNRAINSRQSAEQTLNRFKVQLGLPPDAKIKLKREAFIQLVKEAEQRSKEPIDLLEDHELIVLALENRLDMRTSAGKVFDAQRAVIVAADALRSEVSLLGSASTGSSRSLSSADSDNAKLDLSKGYLSSIISIDLAFERTSERNAFRNKIIALESSIRAAQEKEDAIKLQVIDGIRNLKTSKEGIITQLEAVNLAQKRQSSTRLFLKAGRAEMRDLLEAEESLLSVRNALTDAIISYRIAELNMQKDIGLLQVTDAGLVQEQPLTKLIPIKDENNHE